MLTVGFARASGSSAVWRMMAMFCGPTPVLKRARSGWYRRAVAVRRADRERIARPCAARLPAGVCADVPGGRAGVVAWGADRTAVVGGRGAAVVLGLSYNRH